MADYVVLYDSVTGVIDAMWPRTTSDNIATAAADGHITIDGVKVAAPYDTAAGGYTPALVLLTNPTITDTAAPTGSLEVDSAAAPTDVAERDSGDAARDSKYSYTA